MSISTSHDDRRTTRRVEVHLSATYRSPRRTIDGVVLNLSQTGLFISSKEADPVGTRADVTLASLLSEDGGPTTIKGIVVWSDPTGMGIRFGDLSRDERAALANFIIEHVY